MKIVLDPNYSNLKEFIDNLVSPGWFANNGKTVYAGRNIIKQFCIDGVSLAVKSYGHLSLVNRIIYGVLRKSKGERSYEYAKRLVSLGIDTPKGVAYIEIRKNGLLSESYFVSLYSNFSSLKDAAEQFPDNRDSIQLLDEFATFLVKMHDAGVVHKDLNISNILYSTNTNGNDGNGAANGATNDATNGERYRFQVIDTNRMKFYRHIGMHKRLHTIRRLSCKPEAFVYILRKYAEEANRNPVNVELKGIISRLLFEQRQQVKRELKNRLRK